MKPLALDRALSVRRFDSAGRLHVAASNISKACISPYHGHEIPGWDELGLDPQRIYRLLRPADELAKAAPSFDGLPLLESHEPIYSAETHPHELVVGCVSDAAFDGTYLTASLCVWAASAIDGIESGRARELSCGYEYVADMTPGRFDGAAYDGKMTGIVANHVAIVPQGRVGAACIVADSAQGRTQIAAARRATHRAWLAAERAKGERYAMAWLAADRRAEAINPPISITTGAAARRDFNARFPDAARIL